MRVIVTGAGGFVGRHLVPALRERGHEVRTADVAAAADVDVALDVSDAAAVAAQVREHAPDGVVHLAAIASPPAAARAPELTFRVNFLGTQAVLEAVRTHAPRARTLLVCSADAYGSAAPDAPPFSEASPLVPRSPYARSKAAAEMLGRAHAEAGLDVVCTRSFNHTGPGQGDAFVLSSFARQAAEIAAGVSEPELRVGNLDSVRDFLDVEDVVRAYVGLLEPKVQSGVYNVASGRPVRIGDALDTILRLAGVAPRVEIDPERFRPTDRAVGDATRLRDAIGWEPAVPLEDTLARVVAYWRERVAAA